MFARRMSVGLCFASLCWTTPLYAQSAEGSGPPAGIELFRGEHVYQSACATCHGTTGNGDGPSARYLNPRPRDFTSGTYKFRSTPDGELPTTYDLYRSVAVGVPRTMMPAWEDLLTERDIRDVAAFLRTFAVDFEEFGSGLPITIPEEPDETAATIDEGKNLYVIMQCWTCHGTQGRGDGEAAGGLKDDWGFPIKPFDFTRGQYKAGKESENVFKTLYTGLNGTPMPSYAGSISFGEVSAENMATFARAYSELEIGAVEDYLRTQPSGNDVAAMSEVELNELASRRIWSLVHFVKSLSRKTGIFHRVFVEDTEVTH